MAANEVQMYQISKGEQTNNKENTVLHTLVGDPNRHKPLVQHPPPTTITSQSTVPASMYTLETRHRPIPAKVLPKPTDPKVYYIENAKAEPTPLVTNEETERPLVEPEIEKIIEEEHEPAPPPVFLEPKIISQPIMYSIVGAKTHPVPEPQPISVNEEKPSPFFHAITGGPHRPTIDMPTTNAPNVPAPVIDQPPMLYSIVGNPTPAENIPQTKTIGTTPTIQPTKVSTVQPAPILYTVVGETQVPKNISKPHSPAPIKKHKNDLNRYTVLGDPMTAQSTTMPRRNQLERQAYTAVLYPLVGRPGSLTEAKMATPLKPILQKKTPPESMTNNRRVSRSLDRQTAPAPIIHPLAPIPPIQNKRQRKSKEPTIPKSETIFIPLTDQEREQRSKKPRTKPWLSSPEQAQINHKPYYLPQYDPLHLPDYLSPYAYHPAKPYRQRTIHPPTLPFLTDTHPERKPRPPLYEPPHLSKTRSPHSLERYTTKHKQSPRLWDYEYPSQSDSDDDDEDGLDSSRKKQKRRRFRPRTPWIPVW